MLTNYDRPNINWVKAIKWKIENIYLLFGVGIVALIGISVVITMATRGQIGVNWGCDHRLP